jgi:pentatricopeptide repeat protein
VVIYSTLINGYSKSKRLDEAFGLFVEMPHSGLIPNTVTYNILIGGFCTTRKMKAANELMAKMNEPGCVPNELTYNVILRGFLRVKDIPNAIKIAEEMVESGYRADVKTTELTVELSTNEVLDHSSTESLRRILGLVNHTSNSNK